MDEKCNAECEGLRALRASLNAYREKTDRRLAEGDVTLATINTKLNYLVGLLSGIGAAVLSAVIKFIAG